ncbi:iron-sulfur cluster assembly scaffold protein [Candidatus Heimdallarchaeota archaeon]|nr:MAG: iron-sulfur cluster assembly scaffold protein [Candidatus Heimdallarchaeota archaeon]
MYNNKVIQHFRKPNNYGKLENPDGVGKVGNLVCGDVMWMRIKVGRNSNNEEIISDIKFETFGCVAAIATSSIATNLVKGKTLMESLKIGSKEIVESLGGLPKIKVHCSMLAHDAIAEAIYNYLSKNKKQIPEELEERHKRIEKERILAEHKH